MIKSITLENFQSHVKTVIKPAPAGKLTVIVGPSDSGKTSIIRALRWLFYNTPQGMDFINVKAGAARIATEYADGRQVVRERHRRNYNRYEASEQKFEGFGSGVPLEVQEATGIRPVMIGDMELNLNLAEQLDGPFLGKSVSAGVRAKVLGKLAGTEEIDYAQKQLNTDLYRQRQEEKSLTAEITGLEEQIKEFDYLPALAERIARLENLAAQIKTALERREKLLYTEKKLRQVDEQIWEADVIIRRWRNVEAATRTANEAEYLIIKKEAACRKKQELFAAEEVIKRSAETVHRWRGLEQAQACYTVAESAARRRQEVAKLKDNLRRIQTAVYSTEGIIVRLARIEQAEKAVFAAEEKTRRRKLLFGACEKLQRIDLNIRAAADIRRQWLGIGRSESMIQEIRNAAVQKEEIITLAGKLRQANDLIQQSRSATILWKNKTAELESTYQDQLAALGICPLCQQPIKKPIKKNKGGRLIWIR